MVESVEVKEMAARSKMMKDVLLQEVRSFYASWGDRLSLMTKRHKAEQKKLVARGKDNYALKYQLEKPHCRITPRCLDEYTLE